MTDSAGTRMADAPGIRVRTRVGQGLLTAMLVICGLVVAVLGTWIPDAAFAVVSGVGILLLDGRRDSRRVPG